MSTCARCLVAACAAIVSLAATGAPGEENGACESDSPGGDLVQFTCPLPGTGETPWRFEAFFAGGHDDTSAAMTLTLDGAALACDEGSKTRLFGEYGNVSLLCRFRTRKASGSPPVLSVVVQWSHAQYLRTELKADDLVKP